MLIDSSLSTEPGLRMLAVYGSAYGQTQRIVRRMLEVLKGRGWDVSLFQGDALPADLALDRYDACLVAASVIGGTHQHYIREFVQSHGAQLNGMASAFVSVSGAAGNPAAERQADAQRYLAEFLRITGWRPRLQAAFGGAIAYTKYSVLLRWMMRWIAGRNGGPTDTSRDHELTDWAAVDRFALQFAVTFGHAERRQAALVV